MNRLARERSPYLLQHADNPVDWYPWGDEAFDARARENKPIFLSIGYSTCHWCHVMEHESFENPDVAEALNADFVSIKVDREERPDVDRVYMTFVQSTTGSGGWPMTRLPDAGAEAVLRRHLFPADLALGTARVHRPARRDRARLAATIARASTSPSAELFDRLKAVTGADGRVAGRVDASPAPTR